MSLMDFDGESGGSLLQWPLREAIRFDGFPHISETRDIGRRWAQFPQELLRSMLRQLSDHKRKYWKKGRQEERLKLKILDVLLRAGEGVLFLGEL